MGLEVDNSRCQVIYETCGKIGWGVLLHYDPHLNIDINSLPHTEQMVKKFPETKFIMHGLGWQCKISGDCTVCGGYP